MASSHPQDKNLRLRSPHLSNILMLFQISALALHLEQLHKVCVSTLMVWNVRMQSHWQKKLTQLIWKHTNPYG